MSDTELKARHRKMWASGDYPSMVETFLLPLGPRLVEACGVDAGMRVLDERPHDYADHFAERYGPALAARANARKDGREDELLRVLDELSDDFNLGNADDARFEMAYLLAVGRRT